MHRWSTASGRGGIVVVSSRCLPASFADFALEVVDSQVASVVGANWGDIADLVVAAHVMFGLDLLMTVR